MPSLTDALTPHVAAGEVPGLVALVAHGDEVERVVLGDQAIGGKPMSADSIFRVASITKPIIAAATLMLVDDGRLDLDDAVDDLLPELADPQVIRDLAGPVDDVVPANRPLTTRDLLTFTAGHGFPADFTAPVVQRLFDELLQGPPQPQRVAPPDEWMRALGTIPLLHQPGEGWTYNTGSDVLGVLIARASGRSLPDFLAERICGPLGMTDTGFATPPGALDRFTGYYRRNDDTGALDLIDPPDGQWASLPAFPSGAGGLVSTADDWLAFGRMLLTGGVVDGTRLLSAELVEQMMTDQTTAAQRDYGALFLEGQGWGFGGSVDIAPVQPWNVTGRYGWIGGTGTAAYVAPTGAITILLTQVELGGPTANSVMSSFLRAAQRKH